MLKTKPLWDKTNNRKISKEKYQKDTKTRRHTSHTQKLPKDIGKYDLYGKQTKHYETKKLLKYH